MSREIKFRYLVIGAGDYVYGRTIDESIEIYRFSNYISRMLLGYEICYKNTCPCQSRNMVKELLKKEVIVDFVKFTDYYYGVDYVNELIEMGLWHE